MMRWLALVILVGCTSIAGAAGATYFEIDVARSSVTLTDQSGGGAICSMTRCGIEANLASGFGGNITLNDGDTWDIDFIEFTADGTTGLSPRTFDISATLAFANPVGIDTTRGGQGGGFFVSGVIVGGALRWNDVPALYMLGDGTRVEVDFEDGYAILPMKSSLLTSASIRVGAGTIGAAPVPEPGAALLFATGIAVVALRGRLERA